MQDKLSETSNALTEYKNALTEYAEDTKPSEQLEAQRKLSESSKKIVRISNRATRSWRKML